MKLRKRKTASLVCALVLVLSLGMTTTFAAARPQDAAESLYKLGVLRGVGTNADGSPDFALEKGATRGEAVTEIVRLMGKEQTALSGAHHLSFTDVPDWAAPYVGYGYTNGIIKGYDAARFGTGDPVTAAQYLTMLLRAMGYRDGADFDWKTAYTLSDRIGITHGEVTASNATAPAGFTRGDMASITLAALAAPVKSGTGGATDTAPKTLLRVLLDGGAVARTEIDAAGLGDALTVTGTTASAPATPTTGTGGSSGGGGGSGSGSGVPAAPAWVGSYSVDGVNYALMNVSDAGAGYTYRLGGVSAPADKVLTRSGSSLYKVEMPAGSSGGTLAAVYGGAQRATYEVSFGAAGVAAPKTLYGTVPMKFSEFFHDVTGDAVPAAPISTAFAQGGAVTAPRLFITQGTRVAVAESGGIPASPAYADGDAQDKVDVVSSATYGDSVHFFPTGNLAFAGTTTAKTASDFADGFRGATGIKKVEVGVSFDLYANAELLAAANQATDQSTNVLAALAHFTKTGSVAKDGAITDASGQAAGDIGVSRVKYLLTDGNWGARVAPADGAAKTPKPLPGTGLTDGEAEDVAYGGNWGDKVTGYAFGGSLQAEYAGNNYWDNFAEYIYGGYITDERGHTEPLVFLQNIFSHRAHTDFDVAISPSRFSRLKDLAPYGTYAVTVLAWGFEDITFEVDMKDFVNGGAALSGGTSVQVTDTGAQKQLTVTGAARFDDASAVLKKGAAPVSASDYTISENDGTVTLTLKPSLFAAGYQGAYTLTLIETNTVASKPITFTLINPVRPLLTTDSAIQDSGSGGFDATEEAKLSVEKSDGKLYFNDAAFAAALVTSGRGAFSQVMKSGETAAVSGAFKNADNAGKFYIDLSVLDAGTYTVTAISTGFNNQTYHIIVTE